jgi:uncharacterized membrane protein YhhN
MRQHGFLYAFLVVSAFCLLGRVLQNDIIDLIFKPLIMIFLGLHIWAKVSPEARRNNPIARGLPPAMLFAWLGDTFLLFASGNAALYPWADPLLFFMLGLGSFLIMQLLYIKLYRKVPPANNRGSLLERQPLVVLPFAVVVIAFAALIYPNLAVDAGMMIAICVYGTALASMTIFAANRYERVSAKSFRYVFLGACLFMFSDIVIGLNKFVFTHYPEIAGFVIMATYIPAQYFILEGLVAQIDTQEKFKLTQQRLFDSYESLSKMK